MHRIRTTLFVIAAENLLLNLGFRLWQSLFNNFAVEELAVRAEQIGPIQAVREIPGLMGFAVGLLALLLLEVHIAGISVVLMGVGIFLTGLTRDLPGLIGATLLMSVGFHFFAPSNTSVVLQTVGHDESPRMLGRLNSLGALAAAISTLFILATLDAWGYRTLFQIGGAFVTIVGLALLPLGRQPGQIRRTQRRTTLRRQYGLYYALQFLMGSRRHIFTTFAVFLLVQQYQVTPQTITLLFLINSLIGTYLHRMFGGIVARFGEKTVLVVNFALLTLIFLGYTVIPTLSALQAPTFQVPDVALGSWVLFPAFPATPGLMVLLALFVVDHILFGFSIALQSYFQKIAVRPEEITPNLSLGQTINHVAAVILPVVGSVLWAALGARYTFLTGVAIALVSLALTLRMDSPRVHLESARAPGSPRL